MSAESEDFYYQLYESNATKSICLALAFVFAIFSIPGLAGVIAFEILGSDKKRTLINMMMTSLCMTHLQGLVVVYIPGTINLMVGPMPEFFFFTLAILRQATFYNYIFFFGTISVMKYMYIFRFQNPAAFNDDFWWVFLNIWVNGFAMISQLAWHLSIPRQPIGYYLCAGINPTEYLKTPLKIYGLLEVLSLVLNIFVWVRIKIFKSKEKKISLRKDLFLTDSESMSLTNFGMTITILALCLLAIVYQAFLNKTNGNNINEFPMMFNYYFTILIIPALLNAISLIMLYIKNKTMSKFLAVKIKDWFLEIKENFYL